MLSPVSENAIYIFICFIVFGVARKSIRWNVLREIWLLFFLIILFFTSAYTNISSPTGPAEKYHSIYFHYFGVCSIWEISLGISFLWMILKRRTSFIFGNWQGLPALFVFLLVAFCIGLLHSSAGISPVGPTQIRRVLIAFTGPVYMIMIYLLIFNLIREPHTFNTTINLLKYMMLSLSIFAILRLTFILTGRVQTLWFFAFPVVIYDRLIFYYVPVFMYWIGKMIETGKSSRWLAFVAIVGIILLIISTRRLNLILLITGVALSIIFSRKYSSFKKPQILFPLRKFTIAIVAGFIVIFCIPQLPATLVSVIKSFDLYSATGRIHSGAMRIAEGKNLVKNLETHSHALLTGMGYGTLWQEKINQPQDPLTKKIRPFSNWFSQFHLPYISIFYRFGLLGVLLFILWYFAFFYNLFTRLKGSSQRLVPMNLAAIIFLLIMLPATLDSLNPTSWICCGGLAALLEKQLAMEI